MYRIRTFGVFMLAALMAVAASAIGHAPAVHAQASPTAPAPLATFRGSYDGFSTPLALGPFHLNAGVTVLRARHNGQANFVVSLRMPDPGVDPQVYTLNTYLMVDAIGRFDGGAVQMVPQEGDYYLLLSANGAYDLSVEQPSPTTVSPVIQNTFSGRGQQVTPYVSMAAGPATIAVTTDASVIDVTLYAIDDLGGYAVGTGYQGRIIDTGRGTGTSVAVDLPADGIYLIAVDTGVTGEAWQLSVQ